MGQPTHMLVKGAKEGPYMLIVEPEWTNYPFWPLLCSYPKASHRACNPRLPYRQMHTSQDRQPPASSRACDGIGGHHSTQATPSCTSFSISRFYMHPKGDKAPQQPQAIASTPPTSKAPPHRNLPIDPDQGALFLEANRSADLLCLARRLGKAGRTPHSAAVDPYLVPTSTASSSSVGG